MDREIKACPAIYQNQMPRTYAAKPAYAVRFWTNTGLRPEYVDIVELIKRKARHYFTSLPPSVPFRVICGDSRTLDLAAFGLKFSRVVTSPPYFGMRTYVPDQWLRFWFVGGPTTVTYRHTNQMTHASASDFAEQLASVWTNVSRACLPGAKLVIRFGGIHDRKASPKDIMLTALHRAKCELRLLTVRSAGLSSRGKRRADRFKRTLGEPIRENLIFMCAGGKPVKKSAAKNESVSSRIPLLPGEKIAFRDMDPKPEATDEDLNRRYVKGDIRIVTEAARYPLGNILSRLQEIVVPEGGRVMQSRDANSTRSTSAATGGVSSASRDSSSPS